MAGNNFEFGIGISASGDDAIAEFQKVGKVITEFENSLESLDLDEAFGNFDPSLLKFDSEGLDQIAETLFDIGGILVEMSSDTEKMAAAFGGAVPVLEEAVGHADLFGMELCGVVICAENATTAIQGMETSMSRIPDKAMTVSGHFGRISDASNLLTVNTSQLRHQMTRVYRSMGETAEAADLTASSVLTLANNTKTSWEQIAALQTRLAGAAIGMDDLQGSADENMKTMVMLNESFGLSHDEVQQLAGSMKVMGNSLTDLAGVAVQFQKDFQVPGLINTLPAAAEAAIDAQSQFGSLVQTSSRSITTNIMRMTGVYSRALGITAAQAADKARSTFMKFTGEVESFEDLFLGLADDFTPLQTAFLETGIGMEELERLMRLGAAAPEAFAAEVRGIAASLNPQMSQRFLRQVLRNTDEATRALITQSAAQREANEAAAGAGMEPEDPSATFTAIADAMRENAVDADRMHTALAGVAIELAKLAADEGVRRGLKNVNDVIQGVNKSLIGQYERVRQNVVEFKAYTTVIEGATTAFVGLNDVFSTFTKIVGTGATFLLGFVSNFMVFGRAGKVIWKILKFIGGGFGKLWRQIRGGSTAVRGAGRAAKGFGKILGKLALPIGVAIAAFDGIVAAVKGVGEVLSDPSKSGWDKFEGVVREILGGAWVAIDSFFLGLPGIVVRGFLGTTTATETEGTKAMGEAFGSIFGEIVKVSMEFFENVLPKVFGDGWNSIKEWWGERSLFEVLIGSQMGIIENVKDHIFAFFEGFATGVLDVFGLPAEAIEPMFELVSLQVQSVIDGLILDVNNLFMSAVVGWKIIFNEFAGFVKGLLSGLVSSFMTDVNRSVQRFIGNIGDLARENPLLARMLGIGDAEQELLRSTELRFARAANLSNENHAKRLVQIDEETAAETARLLEAERLRAEIAESVINTRYVEDMSVVLTKLARLKSGAEAEAETEAEAEVETAVLPQTTATPSPARTPISDERAEKAEFWKSAADAALREDIEFPSPTIMTDVGPIQQEASIMSMLESSQPDTTRRRIPDMVPSNTPDITVNPTFKLNIQPGVNSMFRSFYEAMDLEAGSQSNQGWGQS